MVSSLAGLVFPDIAAPQVVMTVSSSLIVFDQTMARPIYQLRMVL
jgi:hypothetical protein